MLMKSLALELAADTVAYLASDAAASVTGAVLSVDRGTAC